MPVQLPDPITMVFKRAGDICIHTFVSAFTDDNIANATHIIESKKKLVLVDAQFLAPYALQFRAYANQLVKKLEKPIERLYLSHRHPDHWFGLGTAFADIPIHALPETISFIEEHGQQSIRDHLAKLAELAPDPDKMVIPKEKVVIPDDGDRKLEEEIDGVKYVFRKVINTEIDFLLTIELPELGVCIPQDLIYSGTHLYLYVHPQQERVPVRGVSTKDMQHWIEILQQLLLSDCDLFMPGHGFPADKNEVARNIEYLSAAKHAIDSGVTKYDFKSFMLQRYPARQCPGIFGTYLPRLFDGVRDY